MADNPLPPDFDWSSLMVAPGTFKPRLPKGFDVSSLMLPKGAFKKTEKGKKRGAYADALGREQARIWDAQREFDKQRELAKAASNKEYEDAVAAFKAAENTRKELEILRKNTPANVRPMALSQTNLEAVEKAYQEALAKMTSTEQAVIDFEGQWDARRAKEIAPLEARYKRAEEMAEKLTGGSEQQKKYDAEYEAARKAYEGAVTQHDKDRAAYDMYKAQKAQYDMDAAQREADLKAGKYAVNPYLFMAQGASLPEIEELRKQVNTGNLRPNMRVPTAPVAPAEVKDPGEFQGVAPEHQRVTDPTVDAEIAALLDYKPPAPSKEDAALPEVSTEKTDTSSVQSNYTTPETTPDKPTEAEKHPAPAPQAPPPPTTNTLQQTSTSAAQPTQQATPQQQPPPAAANPATTLPEQESGTVAGQANAAGQAAPAPAKPEEEAKPFKQGVDESEDNLWETK